MSRATPAATETWMAPTPPPPRNSARDTSQYPLQVALPPIATAHSIQPGAPAIHGDISDSAIEPLTTAKIVSASFLGRRHSSISKETAATATATPVATACQPCIDRFPVCLLQRE